MSTHPLLTNDDFAETAATLGCDVPAIRAVCAVESTGSGFLADGRAKILFESHQFHRLTGGRYDSGYPNLSTPTWVRNYGAPGPHQYDRLEAAAALDHDAAFESCSIGLFQIMGFNYTAAGYSSIDAFWAAQQNSEHDQLDAFAGICLSNGWSKFLAAHDWTGFARHYNGPGFKANDYNSKLAAQYAVFAAAASQE